VRVVGEAPAIQTFPPLTLFRSGWRARWAEGQRQRQRAAARASVWVCGWSGFHSKSLAHVFVQLTTVPYARSETILADAVRLNDARSLSLEASLESIQQQ
jgi:hypothetical protein